MTDAMFPSCADYAQAYRERRCTPLDVAKRFLEGVERTEALAPPLRAFIAVHKEDLEAQARAATERIARGAPLGPLDGVPIAIKDELDLAGYPTTVGTAFLGRAPVSRDATCVARLRAAGALLVGKTNMHEIGIGVTGINPHHGSARNPYDPSRITGGSSSGSAATVASALCPAALGADGGGSIRIPSALCGVTGIKPTFGRVSEVGAAPLCWSLAHIGPIAACLRDSAALLATIAGPDPEDPNTMGQPPLRLDGAEAAGVRGLRIGWCDPWCSEAREDVRAACWSAVEGLAAEGAQVRKIELPYLDWVRVIGYITIGVEMGASQYEHRAVDPRRYGADARLLLALADRVPAVDFVRAQRMRTLILRSFTSALREVDVIVTPATATPAPPLRPEAEKAGESDDEVLEALTAFSFAANLTGLPALAVPVAYDTEGLPIGLQVIARHWEEATALRTGFAVERKLRRQPPKVHAPSLPPA